MCTGAVGRHVSGAGVVDDGEGPQLGVDRRVVPQLDHLALLGGWGSVGHGVAHIQVHVAVDHLLLQIHGLGVQVDHEVQLVTVVGQQFLCLGEPLLLTRA